MANDYNDQLGNLIYRNYLLLWLSDFYYHEPLIYDANITLNLGPKESMIRLFNILRGWFSTWRSFFSHKLNILGVILKTYPYFFND